MPDSLQSPFFASLFEYMKRERGISHVDTPASLMEIIEAGPMHLERKLLEAFAPKEYALRIYRGLPRIYAKGNPAESRVKEHFCHLPLLKRMAAERFVLPLYDKGSIFRGAKVTLFTWVISDGWGDWIAAKEALSILKTRFPSIAFQWVALCPAMRSRPEGEAVCISYEKECPPSLLSQKVLADLRSSDLILSLPTYYPHTQNLMEILKRMEGEKPPPRFSCIGEYGFLESSHFHPKSGHRSMGLHFLEMGILIRNSMSANFSLLENENLLHTLFDSAAPGPAQIERYLDSTKFYLAYLSSPVGGAIYLHALLKANERDDVPIDICTPDIGWFVKYVENQQREKRPLLEGDFKIAQIEVHYDGKVHEMKLSDRGKKVRLLCPKTLSDADFRLLVRLSGEFVGVRGNQSFSEAISAGRTFFYDGAQHTRYFVKDLLALAENRLAPHRNALAVFRGMGKAFLHNLSPEEGEWVDETYFQEKEPWVEIAHSIGTALQDLDTVVGFKKFNRILMEQHAFNPTLCRLVQRELVYREDERLAQFAENQASLFANQGCTLAQYLSSLRAALENL